MRRYIASRSANELVTQLEVEGSRTKAQKRTSGPHRGGFRFRRGSLFDLFKSPIYRGKIVHKGEVYEGEHQAIVDKELWTTIQERLKQKAPPRKLAKYDLLWALLRGLLTDPDGRQMVPTYPNKGTRHYVYYESHKDLARKHHAAATLIGQGELDATLPPAWSDQEAQFGFAR